MFPANCNRCGLCCILSVVLSQKEILEIKNAGHTEEFFLEKDDDGKDTIKRIDGFCIFLEIKKDSPYCKIYDARPKRCRDFPDETHCNLGNHPLFKVSNEYKVIKESLEKQTHTKSPES